MVKIVLRLEGLAIALTALYFYSLHQFSWILFFLLILAPDLSMLGYLKNPRIGAITYNLIHTYVLALALLTIGYWLKQDIILAVALILLVHIGVDRLLQFGLKYPTAFKDTEFTKV